MLVDHSEAAGVVHAFWRHVSRRGAPWHGVDFSGMPAGDGLHRLLFETADDVGAAWFERACSDRAVFFPAEGGEGYLMAHVAGRRRRELRRMRRRLEEMEEVRWKVLFGKEVEEKSIERFLAMEHSGWKGERGTSLRSKHAHEAFFREMITGFRDKQKLFFTELSLDGSVIAATTNLISGNIGFAFKIGYNPKYAKMAPGLLNEVEFIRSAPELELQVRYIDSGADEGSFIEKLWVDRCRIVDGTFGTNALGRAVLSAVDRVRRVKHAYITMRPREAQT